MNAHPFHDILRSRGITQSAVASALGLNKATISRWQRVPAERVVEVERITGIPRHELRPDLAAIFIAPQQDRVA